MMKFYRIPKKVLLDDYKELVEWLASLPKTKRGREPYIFGNIMKDTIHFTWKKDALTFVIKFGGTPVTLEERMKYRQERGWR